MIIPFARRQLPLAVAVTAAVLGAIVALHYHRLGLTLSHYDARGHLVVARRIFDSITPGWQQIGAVWLPLPHVLNAVPVQVDLFYRTGASAVAISIASFAIASGAIAWIVLQTTGSALAAAAAASVFVLNPNVLYLQSTPMTEPLLIALTTTAIAMLVASSGFKGSRGLGRSRSDGSELNPSTPRDPRDAVAPNPPTVRDPRDLRDRWTGLAFALACLTRYEAWPVTAAALALAAAARWRAGEPIGEAIRSVARIAVYPAVAIAGFVIVSRVVIGEWFVAGGFFVPENKAIGDAMLVLKEIGWGVRTLSSEALVWIGGAGLIVAAALAVSARRSHAAVVVALVMTAAIPFAAFYRGHPFRIRYMVPLLAAEAVGAGIAAGFAGRARVPAALALFGVAAATLRPLDARAPMVVEAEWDRPNVPVRATVTKCLGPPEPGRKIMASMGSLGHYMQEASAAGFALRDFLHEGNGDIWLAAIESPRRFADWILIEEKAEGGDVLSRLAREHPHFLDGYSRVCEGAGLALYRRGAEASSAPTDR